MSSEEPATQGSSSQHHHLDADAVCAQCGTTNPEGTLICHNCGNNLRDQRHLRMQAETVLLGQERTPVWRWVARGAIAAVVLLLPLIALNADEFFSWLVSGSGHETARRCWHGPDAVLFDGMKQSLDANFPEGGTLPQPLASLREQPDGFYMLVDPGAGPIGVAVVRSLESSIGFVARLDAGLEIRGKATALNGRYLAQPEDVGIKQGRQYVRGRGSAQPRQEGGLMCLGQSETSDRFVNCVAFPLPDPSAQ